jgi:hypothetical protein
MMRAMTVMADVNKSCHGQRSPWKKRGTTESKDAIIPHTVFGRKWRMIPVIKQPMPTSIP